jgi:hypothetical protein
VLDARWLSVAEREEISLRPARDEEVRVIARYRAHRTGASG